MKLEVRGNFGKVAGGNHRDAPGGTNGGDILGPPLKKLSKNPLKLRLVREQYIYIYMMSIQNMIWDHLYGRRLHEEFAFDATKLTET